MGAFFLGGGHEDTNFQLRVDAIYRVSRVAEQTLPVGL